MGIKGKLMKLIHKEEEYCDEQKVGSEEYVASQDRLKELYDQLAVYNERVAKVIIELIKVLGSIALPIFGWVVITAFEKDDSIRSSLKKTIDCFLPKRLS